MSAPVESFVLYNSTPLFEGASSGGSALCRWLCTVIYTQGKGQASLPLASTPLLAGVDVLDAKALIAEPGNTPVVSSHSLFCRIHKAPLFQRDRYCPSLGIDWDRLVFKTCLLRQLSSLLQKSFVESSSGLEQAGEQLGEAGDAHAIHNVVISRTR